MTLILKNSLLSLLFAFVLLVVSSTTVLAGAYLITEEELNQLDSNLTQLENINNKLRTELLLSKQELLTVRTELSEVQKQLLLSNNELKLAKQDLTKAQNSLQTANEYLTKYDNEVKSEIRTLKLQRTVLGVAAIYLLARK